ncbi:MAG: hypothetical protein ACLP53_13285 [Isosphaeraceae bacterium]
MSLFPSHDIGVQGIPEDDGLGVLALGQDRTTGRSSDMAGSAFPPERVLVADYPRPVPRPPGSGAGPSGIV